MSDNLRSFLQEERRKLINYVRSLISETASLEAEDIVQDVLLKMVERRDDLPPLEGLGAYTYRSLRNRVIDKQRGKRETTSLDQELAERDATLLDVLPANGPEPEWFIQTAEGRALLFKALESLHDIEREVVICHELEGTPFIELSMRLEVTQNTLLSHKARGMKKLKIYFSELDGES
ncbi:MAG: RNA polymerase sigma factor (sigma-70 family) [Candidatus Azotimanducaceae bacterium]|jgi:RNA polymerase sigma factor (sigma-70 family)